MKRKIKKSKIQKYKLARTTSVPATDKVLSDTREGEAENSTVICKDCKMASPIESLVTVDALHMQCPLCLYVFFMEEAQRKTLSRLNPAGAAFRR
jgi:hypothetical protein